MCHMRMIHVCTCENSGVISVIFSQMVSENSGVDSPFLQKFKCHSSIMSYGHCDYPNAVCFHVLRGFWGR